MKKDRIAFLDGGYGLAASVALATILAKPRRVATVEPTPAQVAARTVREERAEWNAAIEAKKAAKRARKNDA